MKKAKQPATKLGETVVGAMMEARNLEGDEPMIIGKLDPRALRAWAEKNRLRRQMSRPPLTDLQNLPTDPAIGADAKARSKS